MQKIVKSPTYLFRQASVAKAGGLECGGSSVQKAEVAAAEWSAFWGWDCCGPGGILDHMYAALHVEPKLWPNLKQLPQTGEAAGRSQRQASLRLVSSYIE